MDEHAHDDPPDAWQALSEVREISYGTFQVHVDLVELLEFFDRRENETLTFLGKVKDLLA